MRALIVNNYTPRNLGDAAIVEGLVFSLRQAGYKHITAAAIYPGDDWGHLGIDEVVESLFRVGAGSRARRLLGLLASVIRAAGGLTGLYRPATVVAYRRADLVVSAGGGYLGAGRILTNLLAGLNVAYGRMCGRRTLVAPMSIRPCTPAVAFILRRTIGATPVFARDNLSRTIFADAGIASSVSSDLALRSPSLGPVERPAGRRMIGWAPRDYARDHVTSWSDEVAAIELRSLMSEGYGVALLTQCTSPSADDRPAVRRAAGLLPEATVLPVAATLQEACAQWAKVDVLVGGRMHAAVGAIRTGAPALAVAYEEKVTGLFEDLGLGDWVIDSAEGLAGRIRSLGSVPRSLPTDWAAFDDQLRPPPPRRRPAIEFAVNLLSEELVRGREILEVGSWAGQGTARSAIEARGPRTYVGTDIAPGPGVDVVCRAEDLVSRFGQAAFDVVLATEVVEHIRDWRSAFRNIMGVLVPGGLLVVTTRSPGYPYHGSPHDYWRYNKLKMSEILMGWDIVALHDDPDRPGIFVAARKPEVVSVDLEQIALFSIAAGREQHQVSTRQIVLHRLSSPRRALAWLVPDWAKPILRRAARPFGYHTDYRGPSKLSQMKPRPKDDEPPA